MFLKALLYLGMYGTHEKIHRVTVRTETEVDPILCVDRKLEQVQKMYFSIIFLDCVVSYCEDDF